MDQSLFVDPDELRDAAAELRARAAETTRMMAELKSDLAREGECWGDDEPGRLFAESYVPESDRNLSGFENLVQNIETLSANLHALAENFENQDRDGGAGIRNSLPNPRSPLYPESGYVPLFDQPNQAANPNRDLFSPEQGRQPTVPSSAGTPVSADTGTPTPQQPPARQPLAGAPADSPGGSSGRGPGSGDSTGAGSQEPSAGRQQTPSDLDNSGRRASAPAAATPPSASAPRSSTPPSTPPPASAPKAETTTAPGTRSPGPKPSAPTAPRSSGVPWSKPGVGSQPGQSAPPRVSPPRRPSAPNPEPKPKQRKDAAPKPSPRPVTADEAMQIIDAMATRHNLRVTGFETSGITTQTALEIAGAVDAVLTKYPLPLRGIAVADGGDELSRVENRAQAAAPEPWIVLDNAVVADPGTLSGRDRTRDRPVELADRAVHARMLRELGQVVDLVGGFRARTMVQRALITEYLRVTGTDGRTLAHVTDGYRRWRDQLSEYCFRNGVLDPGRALSEGFARVEQGGVQTPGPAKVLHRLLLTMARVDMRSRPKAEGP
ncbi:hypothetical protein C5E45_10770 [Nocardia nova]|uniref:WXG100 family type VII secretion target n=1 Tax=Nocardia nova TaxID=37330 RepID=A0A2S6ASQ9_9NOCA|nr:WXG100 family type VII secretion target [Nocardia nova]PPJ30185.1 hypothetical protein C5E41_09770 [Nocardia nova]PPJ38229.1 hypothetical protein C5E45_10770 [Nocardia nova]